MTCDRDLLRILQNLQAKDGWAHVSERVLVEMFEQDTGHAPGQTTIAKALDRIAEDGSLYQVWVQKGGPVQVGFRDIRVAQNRYEKRSFLARRERHKGRREVTTRVQRDPSRLLAQLLTPKPAASSPAPAAALRPRLTAAELEAALANIPRPAPS